MPFGSVIDVAIALVAVYLLVAIISSALLEWLNAWNNRRGVSLLHLLEQLLGTDLAANVMKNPRVSGFRVAGAPRGKALFLSRSRSEIEARLLPAGMDRAPSYIPAPVFAEAVVAELCGNMLLLGEPTAPDLIEAIERLAREKRLSGQHGAYPFEAARLKSLVREASVHCASGQSELTFFRTFKLEIERWFNDANDRLAEQYKRRAQRMLLFIAFAVAAALNADTFNIVRVVSGSGATDVGRAIGWPDLTPSGIWVAFQPIYDLLRWLVGVAICAIAGSLGAPFWFDALNKLVNLRVASTRPPTRTDSSSAAAACSPPIPRIEETSIPLGSPAAVSSMVEIDDFVFGAPNLTVSNAAFMARCAKYAYTIDKGELDAQLRRIWPGCQVEAIDGQQSTQCYVAFDERLVVVAFRGTEKRLSDILADLNFQPRPSGNFDGNCHSGFVEALDEVWIDVEKLLQSLVRNATGGEREFWFTGHSLGAALATLAVARRHKADASASLGGLYTFGSPRVGDAGFQSSFHKHFLARTQRFANLQDGVSRIPPWSIGFRHVGNDAYLDGGRQVLTGRAGWITSLLDTAIEGVRSYKDLPGKAVAEHSMDLYLNRLEQIHRASP